MYMPVRTRLSVLLFFCFWSCLSLATEPGNVEAVIFGQEITTQQVESTRFEIMPGIKSPAPAPSEIDDAYRAKMLSHLIYKEIYSQLDEECQVDVSEAEVQSYIDTMASIRKNAPVSNGLDEMTDGLSEQEQHQLEESLRSFEAEMARNQWQTYYRFKCLHETYGGAVIFQQANPQEPVGAMRAHLEKLESEGKLKINDPDYAEHFWRYYKADYSYVIPPEKVDFSQPWWQRINP